MAKAISKGDMHELRIARLLYVEGSFVRRAIDLNMRFGEDLTVTDLDIFALRFSNDFETSLAIGESKTAQGKKGPKLADRLLWITGLRELIGADQAFVATAKGAGSRIRGLADKLGVRVIDEQDLLHRERLNGLDENASWGPYDPRLLDRQREIYDIVKQNQDLKRIYWFLRSEFWLLDEHTSVKRSFGAMRLLGKFWRGDLEGDQRQSIRWLARHLQINIVVGLIRLAGRSYREEPGKSSARLLRDLASGPNLDYETMTKISREVDRYLTVVLRDLDADPGKQVGALGAFNPSPPVYAEPLIEVIERLAAVPGVAVQLPRFADRQIAALELDQDPIGLQLSDDLESECGRLLRLIGAFVIGQFEAPSDLLDPQLGGRPNADATKSGTSGSTNTQDPQRSESSSKADDPPSSLFDDSGAASGRQVQS